MKVIRTDSRELPVPAWTLAVAAMFFVQLGSALSLPLIDRVGPAGTAWLRFTAASLIFLALARPRCANCVAETFRRYSGSGSPPV